MLRIFVLAAAASVVLAGAALTSTTASAHGRGWHHNHGWHHPYQWRGPRAIYRGPVYGAYNPCIRKRWVPTPWGPQLRVTNVCH